MVRIRLAKRNELDAIYSMYEYRSKWFKENGIKQWSKYTKNHPKKKFSNELKNNLYYVILDDNKIVGGFELSDDSKYWKDDDSSAKYLYRVVTTKPDIGKYIFNFCIKYCVDNRYTRLRTFCLLSNKKLVDIYESKYGFHKNGEYSTEYNTYALLEMEVNG